MKDYAADGAPNAVAAPVGVYAAVLTPLTDRLAPDIPRFVDHCEWLLTNGCDGLAPLGTTGEANSLSVDQRIAMIEALADSAVPMGRAIVGAGSCALADAVRVTRAAVDAGCAGVLCLPPFYYKTPTEDGLFGFFGELIERIGDPRLRLYLYHFPQMSTVPITRDLIARLVTAYPGTIAGLKDSSGDWRNTAAVIRAFPELAIYSGSEQFLLDNLRQGGAGCISATTNMTCRLARAVFTAHGDGDSDADALQETLTEARLTLQQYPFVAGLKALMAHRSGAPGWRNILPPLEPLSPMQTEDLLTRLHGFSSVLPGLAAPPA